MVGTGHLTSLRGTGVGHYETTATRSLHGQSCQPKVGQSTAHRNHLAILHLMLILTIRLIWRTRFELNHFSEVLNLSYQGVHEYYRWHYLIKVNKIKVLVYAKHSTTKKYILGWKEKNFKICCNGSHSYMFLFGKKKIINRYFLFWLVELFKKMLKSLKSPRCSTYFRVLVFEGKK